MRMPAVRVPEYAHVLHTAGTWRHTRTRLAPCLPAARPGCRNEDICSTFVGMYTTKLVDASLKTARDTLGLAGPAGADGAELAMPADESAERQRRLDEVLAEVMEVLAPVKDVTWPSGRWQGGP